MKRKKIIGLLAVLAIVVAACSSGDAETTTTEGAAPDTTEPAPAETTTTGAPVGSTTAAPADNPLADYGEDPGAADPALVEKALGPVEPSAAESWNIVLASIARANQDLDEATIATAMDCWNNSECDTGSGGELVMGYADGGGKTVNVWRGVSRMEAILQALSYEQIGKIVTTEANFGLEGGDPVSDIQFLIQYPVDFIVGYPDIGAGLADVVSQAEAAGIPYVSFSAGYVGLPGAEGALTPGEDYTAVVGEDLCALGTSFGEVLTGNVTQGAEIGLLGGTPGNALTLGWQQCTIPTVTEGGLVVANPPANESTTTGDTYWVNSMALDMVRGILTTNPEIAGWAYEYSDGLYTALQAYDELGIPVQNLSVALRTDEQTLFCDWAQRNEPTYNIWFSAGGNFQSRTGVTTAMLALQGYEVPGEVVVPHVMRQVTAADCNPDRVNEVVSGTSLVPDALLAQMYGGQ